MRKANNKRIKPGMLQFVIKGVRFNTVDLMEQNLLLLMGKKENSLSQLRA